ncbi:MAG: transposase [Candidatus Altiarchaeales archaeon]|nr:transposase [Candidatus Altiarchaeales archaeon]
MVDSGYALAVRNLQKSWIRWARVSGIGRDSCGHSALMEKKNPDAKKGCSKHKGFVTGFKAHVACDADSGLPVLVRLTTGNRHDSPLLPN